MLTRRRALGGVLGSTVLAVPFASRSAESFADSLTGDLSPVHDPCIIKQGSTYHLFSTSQANEPPGLIHWRTSPNLRDWALRGAVLPKLPDWAAQAVPGTRGAWAPDIAFFNGRYHLYYSLSTFGKNQSAIALVTTPTLDMAASDFGWKDEGVAFSSKSADDFNAIDPNIVIGADGRHWLAFGSFWGGLKIIEIDAATGKPKASAPLHGIAARGRPGAVEAPFIIQRKGDYYLFASYDFCCRGVNSTYYTVVGRSKDIVGPYVDRAGKSMMRDGGFVVLHGDLDPAKRYKGPGHPAILQDGTRDYIVYHAYDAKNRGRATLRVAELGWSADGWPVAL